MGKKYSKVMIVLLLISLLSKIAGMLRESFIASAFGAGYEVDAYNIAYIVPFLLFSLIGPALTTTFIPILSETYEKDSKKEMYKLANNVISIVLSITIIVFILGELFPDIFVGILAPKFNKDTMDLAISLTRLSMINVLFIGLNYGFISILNVLGEFTSTGITGLLLNIPIILYVTLNKSYRIESLMFYTMIGYGIQILAHIPFLLKHNYKYKFNISFNDNRIKRMIGLIIPIIIGIGVNQVNVIIDRMMASGLQEGTISAIAYANKTNDIVYTLLTSSIMVVIFPIISKSANKNDNYFTFKNILKKVEEIIIFIIVPATLLLAYLREDVLTVLFKYGAFNNQALKYTSIALFYLSFSTIFYLLRDIYNKGLLALQDTKSSVINTSIGMLINIVINLATVNKLGIVGLCLGTTISSVVTSILLRRKLYKKIDLQISKHGILSRVKIFVNSILMIIVLEIFNEIIFEFLDANLSSIIKLTINLLLGIIIYFIVSYFTKSKELLYLINEIKEKVSSK